MHIEEEITGSTMTKYEMLSSLDRGKLSEQFEAAFGWPAHPRIEKDFLAKAMARKFQDTLWIEKTGSIPDKIRQASINFWNNNEVPFVNKEAMKDEKAMEMSRGRVETRKPIRKVERNVLGVQAATVVLLDPKAAVPPNYAVVVKILEDASGRMTFSELERKCNKVIGKSFNLSAALVILNARKIVKVQLASTVVDDVETEVSEEKLPDVSIIVKGMLRKDTRRKTIVLGEMNYAMSTKTAMQVVNSHC